MRDILTLTRCKNMRWISVPCACERSTLGNKAHIHKHGSRRTFLRPSGCERPGNSAASSSSRHSTIRSKRRQFFQSGGIAESPPRVLFSAEPLALPCSAQHTRGLLREGQKERSITAAALRLSSSQSQAPAR